MTTNISIKDQPLVSIIVPVYNTESFLKSCLDSIVHQTYQRIEILIVDDGSTDHSAQICQQYAAKDPRIQIICQQNHGLAHARNTGLRYVTGQYLTFVDSDDEIDLRMISALLSAAQTSQADVVISGQNTISAASSKTHTTPSPVTISTKQSLNLVLAGANFYHSAWGKLFKTTLLQNIRFPNSQLYEDINTIYRIYLQAQKIIYLNQSYYHYNTNATSITRSNFRLKHLDMISASDQLANDVVKYYPELFWAGERCRMYANLVILGKMLNAHYRGSEYYSIISYIQAHGADLRHNFPLKLREAGSIFLIEKCLPLYHHTWHAYSRLRGVL